MNIKPIEKAEDILANQTLFASLNSAEQLAVICSVKSNADTMIAVAKAEIAARQTALDVTAAAVLNPLKEKSRAMKAMATDLLTHHRKVIMGDDKSLEMAGQAIGYRWTNKVECDGDEEEAMRALDQMAADVTESEADRMCAEACINRPLPTLNKPFIMKCAKTSLAWLRAFGLRVERVEKLTIKPTATEEDNEP